MKTVKEKISNEQIKLDERPVDLSSDDEKINELIDIYFLKVQNEAIKHEYKAELGLQNNSYDFKQWDVIHDTTNILIKLIQLKNKIKK